MPVSCSDYEDILEAYNLAGGAGKLPIGSLVLPVTALGSYKITYTVFTLSSGANIPYLSNDAAVQQHLANSSTYKQNVEVAFNNIMQHGLGASQTNIYGDYSSLFQDVANIVFEASPDGIITFGQLNKSSPYISSEGSTAQVYQYDPGHIDQNYHGDIWINAENDLNKDEGPSNIINIWNVRPILPGTQAYKILLEEVMHGLGVDIVGADQVVDVGEGALINSHKYTVTSYKSHPDMDYDAPGLFPLPGEDADYIGPYPKGLQLLDIAALQAIYGRNYGTRAEGNIYRKEEAFASNEEDGAFVYTIWDGGGNDKISALGYDTSAQIDLRQGRFSSIGYTGGKSLLLQPERVAFDTADYDAGNVAISYYTVIENAKGTDHADVLIGNAWGNTLDGGAGNDTLYGDGFVYDGFRGFTGDYDPLRPSDVDWQPSDENGSGDDKFYGGTGVDTMFGGYGNDVFIQDTVIEGDSIYGGGFKDHANLSESELIHNRYDGKD